MKAVTPSSKLDVTGTKTLPCDFHCYYFTTLRKITRVGQKPVRRIFQLKKEKMPTILKKNQKKPEINTIN